MEVSILAIEHFFEQVLYLGSKVFANGIILHGVHQVLELRENSMILARIELSFLLSFQQLKLKEKLKELVITFRVGLQIEV